MNKTTTILFLVLFALLLRAHSTTLILAPYTSIPANTKFDLWGMLDDDRDAFDGATYQWTFQLSDGVTRVPLTYFAPEYMFPEEEATSPLSLLTGTVHDAWNIPVRQSFTFDDNAISPHFTATLTVSRDTNIICSATRTYQLHKPKQFSSRADAEKWRTFAILTGLHWLQKRQRPSGGWPDIWWWYYGDFQEYDDYAFAMEPIEGEVMEVPSEYWDSYNAFSATVCALWAFGNCGYGLDNATNNPFRRTVRAAIDYITSRSTIIPIPGLDALGLDENRNGAGALLGNFNSYRGYTQPMAIAALLAAGTRNTTATLADNTTVTLLSLVQDAFDRIASIQLKSGKAAWPYDYGQSSGFDLSIAGWNYLAIEAISNWNINVPDAVRADCLRLLFQNHDPVSGGFSYSATDYTKTVALTAAGIVALTIAADADLLQDAAWLCPEQSLTAGALAISAMRHLPKVMDDRFVSLANGYFAWTLVRALRTIDISSFVFRDKMFDWRYADESLGGIWHRILKAQQEDGSWVFSYNDFLSKGFYSREMETAFMLLALSDEVVRKNTSVTNLLVTASIPNDMADTMLANPFQSTTSDEDATTLAFSMQQWDLASPINLDISTLIPDGDPASIRLQNAIHLSYNSSDGVPVELEAGPLNIQREGQQYSLHLTAPETACVGAIVPITLTCTLPPGESLKSARMTPGADALLTYDKPVSWSAIFLNGTTDVPFATYLPDARLSRRLPLSLTPTPDGTLLRPATAAGVSLCLSSTSECLALVYHVSSRFQLLLQIENTAYERELLRDTLSAADFPSTLSSLSLWETDGLKPAPFLCTASLLCDNTPVATSSATITLLPFTPFALDNAVSTDKTIYSAGEPATIISHVSRTGFDSGGATVSVKINNGTTITHSITWRIDSLDASDAWNRNLLLPSTTPGCFTVEQYVTADNGATCNASAHFTVIEPDSDNPELIGFFHQNSYTIEKPNPLSGLFTIKDPGTDAGGKLSANITVFNIADDGTPEEIEPLRTKPESVDDFNLQGSFSIPSTENIPTGTYLLALSGKSANVPQNLLDIASVTLLESSSPDDPDATDPDATEPDATEPDPTEPDPTDPDATEPDSSDPDSTEPDPTEPDATDPDATEPDSTEPDATDPDATDPDATDPDATDPDATEPDSSDPDSTEPDATDPDATDPDSTEPDATDPDATDPDVPDPDVTPRKVVVLGGTHRILGLTPSSSDGIEEHDVSPQLTKPEDNTPDAPIKDVVPASKSPQWVYGEGGTSLAGGGAFLPPTVTTTDTPAQQEIIRPEAEDTPAPMPGLVTRPPELNLLLETTRMTDGKAFDVLAVVLPTDWPSDGILNIAARKDGLHSLRDTQCDIHIIREGDLPYKPLLTLHLESTRQSYTIAALQKLAIAGRRNTIGDGCCLRAADFSPAKSHAALVAARSSQNELQRFRTLWLKLTPLAIKIDGDLTVRPGEELQPGTYLVSGNVRFRGNAPGPVTILTCGNIILTPRERHLKPHSANLLILARKGIFLMGEDSAFSGDICALDSEVRVIGRRQSFCNGGIWGTNISIRGSANAFLAPEIYSFTTE